MTQENGLHRTGLQVKDVPRTGPGQWLPPPVAHQRILRRLLLSLDPVFRSSRLGEVVPGPVAVLVPPGETVYPDLVFLRRGGRTAVAPRGIVGPPELVVEIVEPRTVVRDRGARSDLYGKAGVGQYWIVDGVARNIEVRYFFAGAVHRVFDQRVPVAFPDYGIVGTIRVPELFTRQR